jgi:DTW domain-containing protein YfiP
MWCFPASTRRPSGWCVDVPPLEAARPSDGDGDAGKRPLFILLDGPGARRARCSAAALTSTALPVLSLQPEQITQYKLRRSGRDDHFCTSEVAALCMKLAGEHVAEQTLEAYLAVFTHHYLQAKNQQAHRVGWRGAPAEGSVARGAPARAVQASRGRCLR